MRLRATAALSAAATGILCVVSGLPQVAAIAASVPCGNADIVPLELQSLIASVLQSHRSLLLADSDAEGGLQHVSRSLALTLQSERRWCPPSELAAAADPSPSAALAFTQQELGGGCKCGGEPELVPAGGNLALSLLLIAFVTMCAALAAGLTMGLVSTDPLEVRAESCMQRLHVSICLHVAGAPCRRSYYCSS